MVSFAVAGFGQPAQSTELAQMRPSAATTVAQQQSLGAEAAHMRNQAAGFAQAPAPGLQSYTNVLLASPAR